MGLIADNIKLAEELTRYSRLCYDRMLVGACGGNLSVRVPDRDVFLVTAGGVSLRDVAPENIVAVDAAGAMVEGPEGMRPSKETGFHLAIYAAKPQVNAVVHVHPPFTTAYTCEQKQIPLLTVSAKLKVRQSLVVPEQDPGSAELCAEVARAVKESPDETTVILLGAHGLVAYRGELRDAFDDAELLENTAQVVFYRSMLK